LDDAFWDELYFSNNYSIKDVEEIYGLKCYYLGRFTAKVDEYAA